MFTYEQWKDIFADTLIMWLVVYFGGYYFLRLRFRRAGKSVKNLELKVLLTTLVPWFAFMMLTAPNAPMWLIIILIAISIVFPLIGWAGYKRMLNPMRRSLGMREWDWDQGEPVKDKDKTKKDEDKKSAERK